MVDPVLKKKRRLRARFWASESGVSALEFALVAPFFLILLGGIGVGGQFLTSTRHTAAIASTIGNLATQVQTLHDTDVADIFAVGQVLIAPMPTNSLGMRLTSIEAIGTANSWTAKVQWSNASGTMSPMTVNQVVTVPTGLLVNVGDSVVLAEATYTFTPPLTQGFGAAVPITKSNYFKPRLSPTVVRASP